MRGQKAWNFRRHDHVCVDDLVPAHHFYRQLEAKYCWWNGPPSLDPMVFFKLQLSMFFEGIRSERQLMKMVNLILAHRWYIGYDLDEAVPDHSSLSKIRNRYGFDVFQQFFEQIVELCIEAGLVWGKELYFDGTKVRANADKDSLEPHLELVTQQHLQTLFPEYEPPEPHPNARRLIDKYNGTRILSRPSNDWYHRTTDRQVSRTDSDATPMKAWDGEYASLGYHTHYVVDGGKARIILAALVPPASVMDNTSMLDLARWVRFRWQVSPQMAVGAALCPCQPAPAR